MASTEYMYGGQIYSTDPQYNLYKPLKNPYGNFTGYQIPISQIGTSVDARTANQLKEVSEHLNSGIKIVEVAGHDAGVFESIPKEHLKELNRLATLTGAELTLHAPMVDPSGITQHGWDKMNQKSAEEQLWQAVKRSHDLNPKGNVNVTFHASTAQLPPVETKVVEEGEEKPKTKSLLIINKATGEIGQIKEEERYLGRGEFAKGTEPLKFDAQKQLDEKNEETWMRVVTGLNYAAERATQTLHHAWDIQDGLNENPLAKKTDKEIQALKENPQNKPEYELAMRLKEKQKVYEQQEEHGKFDLLEAYRNTKELYNDIYKNASPEKQAELRKYAEDVTPFINNFNKLKDREEIKKFKEVIEEGIKVMKEAEPKIYTPLKDFAVEKTAETTANIALKAYNEFGKSAPIIALENHPAYASLLTTGEDLKDVINKARENFVQAAKKQGLSDSEAKRQAEKLIGATWDVGHINMLKRYGYKDKDILEQTKAVAPFVKKVHLSDNFGMEHTELPMGMGNVPIADIMKELGKGEKGFEGPKIVEALNWWQHFSPGGKVNPPFVPTMQAFGSPIYGMNWNQVYGVPGGYFGGYGTMLPEQHFQMYGAGFSNLPMELGGQVASTGKDRFSGTPMA